MRVDTGAIWRFVVKNWPQIVAALTTANRFLKDHPDLQAWWRQRLNDVSARVVAVQRRRSEAARIRGVLDIIRDVAHELETHQEDHPGFEAAPWVRRADDIELGVRLAETQARAEQRRTLGRLRTETDALLAQLLDATARLRSLPVPEEEAEVPAEEAPAEDGRAD
jgi:hypothetical protein